MATIKVKPTNGVSYGIKYTVTTADATATEVIFDFRKGEVSFRFPLVASVQIVNSSGVVTMPADLAITYTSNGVIKVAGTLDATTVIHLVAQATEL